MKDFEILSDNTQKIDCVQLSEGQLKSYQDIPEQWCMN